MHLHSTNLKPLLSLLNNCRNIVWITCCVCVTPVLVFLHEQLYRVKAHFLPELRKSTVLKHTTDHSH